MGERRLLLHCGNDNCCFRRTARISVSRAGSCPTAVKAARPSAVCVISMRLKQARRPAVAGGSGSGTGTTPASTTDDHPLASNNYARPGKVTYACPTSTSCFSWF